jgi:ketosteroid isomerase-like protein
MPLYKSSQPCFNNKQQKDKPMRKFYVLFVVLTALITTRCDSSHNNTPTANSAAYAQIEALMAAQIAAWDRGDLEGFMSPYAQTDSLLFVNKNGLRYGWQANLEAYQTNYGDAEKRGQLRFENLHHTFLGSAHVQVTGKWTVDRGATTVSGYYTLIWEKQGEKWVIVLDHTS